MNHWDEVRTAYQVARLGTVSAAAEMLGVHRATVIRHIDSLEINLGTKIFHRHAKGYTPTEAGRDLMRVAKATDEQFSQFTQRVKGRTDGLSGDFVVTSVQGLTPLLLPFLQEFQAQHPSIVVRYLTSPRLFQLEYGEAHVALRTGRKPDLPDNIVQPFKTLNLGLYASKGYIERHSQPQTLSDFTKHYFVWLDMDLPSSMQPLKAWIQNNVPKDNIVFQSNNPFVLEQAIVSGIGIGFCPAHLLDESLNLIEIWPPETDWNIATWIVTHVDLHQIAKVQAFLKLLRETKL